MSYFKPEDVTSGSSKLLLYLLGSRIAHQFGGLVDDHLVIADDFTIGIIRQFYL
jgi:hypothetical protein